jgi:uncharacterized membrane protein SirB2
MAGLSLLGFLIRGYWMITENALLQSKPSKILPHIIDTLLLASAIYLVIILQVYPFVIDWVTVKVFLLIAYIVLGVIALKRGKTKKARIIAFILAVATVLGLFAVASIKPVLG